MTKSAALAFGIFNITVNAAIPGFMDPSLTRHQEGYAQALEGSGGWPGGFSRSETSLGESWVGPEDVAPVALLASDTARMEGGAA